MREVQGLNDSIGILDKTIDSLSRYSDELYNSRTLCEHATALGLFRPHSNLEKEKARLIGFCEIFTVIAGFPGQGDGIIIGLKPPMIGYYLDRWQALVACLSGKMNGSICNALDRYIDEGIIISELFCGSCSECGGAGLLIVEFTPGPITTVLLKCKNCQAKKKAKVKITGHRLRRLKVKEDMTRGPEDLNS